MAGDFQPCAGAFDHQFPLYLGQAGHDVKKEAAGWRASIDGIGQTLELDTLLMQFTNQIDQILDAASQAIQFPNHERVALAQHFQCLGESWTLGSTATDLVVVNLFTARLGQGFGLKVEVLFLSRDAGIADQQGLLSPPSLMQSSLSAF